MASKETNDSVERIMREVNQRESENALKKEMANQSINDILAGYGIHVDNLSSYTPRATQVEEDEVDAIMAAVAQGKSYSPAKAEKPKYIRPVQEVQQPAVPVRPAKQSEPQVRQPIQPPVRQQDVSVPQESDTLDTTNTGITNFLQKMAPGENLDTEQLKMGKDDFKNFFANSVAVVPDEKGRLPAQKKKKHGLFGLGRVEDDTEEQFVPINVALANKQTQEKPEEAPQEEYLPDAEPEEKQTVTAQPSAKKGGLFGWFGGQERDMTGELLIPEPREEPEEIPHSQVRAENYYRQPQQEQPKQTAFQPEPQKKIPAENPTPRIAAEGRRGETGIVQLQPPMPGQQSTVEDKPVYHSKYTRAQAFRNEMLAELGFDTNEFPTTENVVVKEEGGGTSTKQKYHKKRDTVEFTPAERQRYSRKAKERPADNGEPVGEPISLDGTAETQKAVQHSGFTQNIALEQPQYSQSAVPRHSGFTQNIAVEQPQPPKRTAPQHTGFTQSFEQQKAETGDTLMFVEAYSEAISRRKNTIHPVEQPQQISIPQRENSPIEQIRQDRQPELQDKVFPEDEDEQVDSVVDSIIRMTTGQQPTDKLKYTDPTGVMRLKPAEQQVEKMQMPQQKQTPPPQPSGRPRSAALSSDFVDRIADSIISRPTESFKMDAVQPVQPLEQDKYAVAANRLMDGDKLTMGELTGSISVKGSKDKKKKNPLKDVFPVLAGKPADESTGSFTAPFELPKRVAALRYENEEDAPAVRAALQKEYLTLTVATVLTAILAAALIYLGIAATGAVGMPGALNPTTSKIPLLAVYTVLLIAAAGISWRTIAEGAQGMVGRATPDSMPMLATLGALIQLVVFLIKPDLYEAEKLCIAAGPAVLLLCFNNLGKAMDAKTILENFKLVSSDAPHYVSYRLREPSVLRGVTSGLSQVHPVLMVNRKAKILKNFIAQSHSRRGNDKNQQQFARILAVFAVLSLAVSLILTRNVGSAVTAMAAMLSMSSPLVGTLLTAFPAHMLQRNASTVGAVVPGWQSMHQLGRANMIHVSSKDMFPDGCVSMCGIKPVHKECYDSTILYAASMFYQDNTNLKDIFFNMVGCNEKMLLPVEEREEIYGKGYVGWIHGERILAGNRVLMEEYGVKLPTLEYEQRHTVNQRRVIYLAVSGSLYAMFQVAYQRDPDTAHELEILRRAGMSLVVDCDDFNCDAALLEAAYSLPAGTVKVLNGEEHKLLESSTAWVLECEGSMMHLGSFASIVGGIQAARSAEEGERKSVTIMSASVLLSCVLALVMVFNAGFAKLPLPYILLYQAAWAVLALIFPVIQKY